MKRLQRLIGFARPYAFMFALSIFLLFASFAMEAGIFPWIVEKTIDGPVKAASALENPGEAELEPYIEEIIRLGMLFLFFSALCGLIKFSQTYLMGLTGQKVILDIRQQLVSRMETLPLSFYDVNPVGRLVTRVTSDVETLNELFTSGFVTIFYDSVKIIGIVVILYTLQPRLTMVVVAVLPLMCVAAFVFRHRARKAYRAARAAIANVNSFLQEAILGIKEVQLFTKESWAQDRFDSVCRDHLGTLLKTVFYYSVFFSVVSFFSDLILGGTFFEGGSMVGSGELTFGRFIRYWMLLYLIFEPVQELAERYSILQSAMASSERIFGILDLPTESPSTAVLRPLGSVNGAISFENVSFAYEPGKPVIEDLSFDVCPGELVAVVGATGAGKTTLGALLLKQYEPCSGCIRLDGIDIRQIDTQALRKRVGTVPQDVFLFSGSVADNVLMEREKVRDSKLERILEAAGAMKFVRALPEGWNTPVMERGSTLSVGQKQLIAIARALAYDPEVLVLDEAYASVDTKTERLVQAATGRLLQNRTSIVIAHRISTIMNADRILVIHKGKLREMGTHKSLIAEGGIYSRLYELQFEGREG